jgi:hypothetical protein
VSAEVAARGFGRAADEPRPGVDLGAGGVISVDVETGIVFDFFVTHDRVFAVYERLALRPGAEFAAFTYAVPVADRTPDVVHRLEVTFDRTAAAAHWRVDGRHVLSVDRIGFRSLDDTYLTRDNGRREEEALPRQFSYGLGLFANEICGQGVELSVRSLQVCASPRP